MQLIKMKYKEYVFDINPSSIKFDHSKTVANQSILNHFDNSSVMSVKPISIIGSGILVGDDRFEQMVLVQNLFNKKDSDYLFLPGFSPIKAYFSELSFSLNSNKNAISYSFKFVEDNQGKKEYYDFGYTIAKKGENLFDIANRLNVEVELLVGKNDFEDLFAVKEGDKVYYA